MDEFRIHTRTISPVGPNDRDTLSAFLAPLGLDLEDDVELAVVVEDGGIPVATAALAGDVVKCVGVLPEREGEGAAARAVSAVVAEADALGRRRLFVYTKPINIPIFLSLGFSTLAEVPTRIEREGVALLENDEKAFAAWVDGVRILLPAGKADGAVVVNCNPFTLGHRYLIETSAAACRTLLVLVVAGDRSSFPGAVREALVRAGTADIAGVVVASGGPYCVSGATFPSYYLKKKSDATDLQAELDARLFAERIAPALGIARRFVGTEPYCAVTASYNRALASVLPERGVELVEIPRAERGGAAISASAVRDAIRAGDMDRAASLVPPTTAAWLASPEAGVVLERIRAGSSRH